MTPIIVILVAVFCLCLLGGILSGVLVGKILKEYPEGTDEEERNRLLKKPQNAFRACMFIMVFDCIAYMWIR